MQAFTIVTQPRYVKKQGNEYIWKYEAENDKSCILACTILGSETIRVRLLRNTRDKEERYQLVDGRQGSLPYHSWTVAIGDEQWATPGEDSDYIAVLEPYLQEFAFKDTQLRLMHSLTENEHIYGLGERTGSMDKRGQSFPIWNIDPPGRHNAETETMYTSIPFYFGLQPESGRAYGIFIDHVGKIDADLGKSSESIATFTIEGDELDAYFFAGPTPADVLRQYTALSGHMPLPARWTLGHHQSRWGYKTEQDVSAIADLFRERKHPCDAIWLDIDYMDGYRNFTWDPQRFPDPVQLTQKLHAQNFHLVTILDPGTRIDEQYDVYKEGMDKGYFCHYQDGRPFIGSVWPGDSVFPDFSCQKVRDWWGNLYKRLLDVGVDGIWNDMDEPSLTNSLLAPKEEENDLWGKTMDPTVLHEAGGEQPAGPDGPAILHELFHNAYGMEMARTTYEGQLRLRPDTRPFVLTRSGTAGMQKYAALWTGDNTSEWEHISLALRMGLNISMSGVAFVGSDIGGFWDASNGELLTRFAQLGALLPFCRNHNAIENPDQEPWAFGEPYESAYRKAIETRYQLLPYLYTLFHQSAVDGAPIIRPLFYHYPQDEEAYDTETEFMIGDALLSAPISEKGATSRDVYLPEGLWLDYWDGTEYPGAGTSEIAAPIDRWPLFVRGNSILPTGPVIQYTNQETDGVLTLSCYMTTDGLANYTLYEDDGQTQAYRNGAFATTNISCRVDNDAITVRVEEHHQKFQPLWKEYQIVVYVGNHIVQQRIQTGRGVTVIRL